MEEFTVSAKEKYEIIDITEKVKQIAAKSKKKDGICVVYVPHATCAVIINENYDPNVGLDFLDALNKLVPEGKWRHDRVDNNGAAHIKAAIVGPSETVFVKDGKLVLGRWQDIMVACFDGPKEARVIVKIQ